MIYKTIITSKILNHKYTLNVKEFIQTRMDLKLPFNLDNF